MVLAALHSYLGERYTIIRLLRRELPHLFGSDVFTKQVIRFAWHLTSVVWFGLGVYLIALEQSWPSPIRILAITFFVSGLLPIYFTKGKHLSWVFFFAIAALLWWS